MAFIDHRLKIGLFYRCAAGEVDADEILALAVVFYAPQRAADLDGVRLDADKPHRADSCLGGLARKRMSPGELDLDLGYLAVDDAKILFDILALHHVCGTKRHLERRKL